MRTTFTSVPDAPVSRFILQLHGGERGLLVNSTDLCRSGETGLANFGGQNGKRHVVRNRVGMAFRGCRQVRRQVVQKVKRHKALRRAAVVRRAARS